MANSTIDVDLVELGDHLILTVTGQLNIQQLFEENNHHGIQKSTESSFRLDSNELEIELNDKNRTDLLFYSGDFNVQLPAIEEADEDIVFDKTYHAGSCDYLHLSLRRSNSIDIEIHDDYATDGTEDIIFMAYSKDYDLDDFGYDLGDDNTATYSWTDTVRDGDLTINVTVRRIASADDFVALTASIGEAFEGDDSLTAVNAVLADAYPGDASGSSDQYQGQWLYGGAFAWWVYSHLHESWAYPAYDEAGNIAFLYLHESEKWVPNNKL
ncbi:hypothetical protein [Rubellicoccus peritrichatus]|uniref:Uncharacterized protein n=1 Tax=Rubellicoccus peritrichatus TaxID=3080537 RepID=A0AAQ3L6A8_9BACT|nr:hypothetical protein [Puniceicoccus sp. CR14]WOO39741.1 hypothetical protein RZN69_14045 [Puniceicoccus sp. CR14]